MASVDDLFKKPNTSSKRKLEDPTSSFAHRSQNKAAKLTNGSSAHASTRSNNADAEAARKAYQASAVEENAEELDEDDTEAGPTLPPDDAEDEPGEEDDEGRFFGGGVSRQERQVLDYIDENEAGDTEEKIDLAWLKKTAISFERRINKNAELRAKYEDEPMKFVASEADLDTEIKGLGLLSEHTELYKDFAKMGCVASLVGLLAHENTDIAIAVCELLAELTDEDSVAEEQQWLAIVKAMVEADIVDLLASNLGRLDEVNENDRAGVYHVLSLVENLLSDTSNLKQFGDNMRLLEWLKQRINKPDPDARAKVSQNRQYAAEILAILLSGNEANRQGFSKIDGVEVLLQLLSSYRKRDPEKDSDEEEFVENLFDCLVAVVKDDAGADNFMEAEGIELCLIMLREGKLSKSRAIRVLDHALGGKQAAAVGDRLIEAAGLKTLFSLFMKSKKQDREAIEHMVGIFSSLLRYLPADSAARIRTLAKFVEKDYEKISHLIELRSEYSSRISNVDKEIQEEKKEIDKEDVEDLEAEILSRRFDAGLFTLQTLDVILSWLAAEDGGARKKVSELLATKSGSHGLLVLKQSLQEQIQGLDDKEGEETREMLEALMRCLA